MRTINEAEVSSVSGGVIGLWKMYDYRMMQDSGGSCPRGEADWMSGIASGYSMILGDLMAGNTPEQSTGSANGNLFNGWENWWKDNGNAVGTAFNNVLLFGLGATPQIGAVLSGSLGATTIVTQFGIDITPREPKPSLPYDAP
jgi:hypothetical protein